MIETTYLRKFIKVIYLIYCSIFLITILFSSGCGNDVTNKKAASPELEEGVYVIGDVNGDWGYPTPFAAYPRGPGFTRASFIFDSLLWKDEEGFVPALAKDWEYDEENLTYIFELQEDVNWHDGEKMTVDDVVFTYKFLKENPYNWADLSVIKEVAKKGDREVEITLERPMGAFLNNIAGVVMILPEHIWSEVDNPVEFSHPEAVIGTGPYKLKDYNRDQGSYRYSANEEYYLGEPKYSELQFVKVSDPQLAIQRGDIDFVRIEPEAVSSVENQGIEVIAGSHDWNLKLMFNHKEQPFDQAEFRRALTYFIDTDMIVKRALRGHGLKGSTGLISPDSRWYNEDLPDYSYNPDKGKEKLKELGYQFEDGHLVNVELEKIEIKVFTSGTYSREGELIGEFLEDAGIEVELRSFESSVLDDKIKNWDFELVINGHGAVGGDPERVSQYIVGDSVPHLNIQYENPELVENLEAMSRETNENKRMEAAHEAQQIYATELPAYTLYHPTWYYAHNGELEWFFTKDSLAHGIPLPLNKLAIVEYNR